MNRKSLSRFVVVTLWAASAATAAEQTVARKNLPAAVERALAKELADATLKGITSEPCEGSVKSVCYEVETTRGNHSRDFVIDASGAVVEVEEAVALADLPAAVTTSAAKVGKVLTAEKVTRGAETSYELLIEKAGRKSERTFLADGTPKK